VYATDILLVILFGFWFVRSVTQKGSTRFILRKHDYFLFAFIVISAISIKNTSALYLSGYHFLKLVEFVLFYFYLKTYVMQRFNFSGSLLALIAGGTFQAVIAIVQFLKQSDIGLRLLGEGLLDPQMRGVAVFYNLVGDKVMRAYGTNPHPNILAAYLFLTIFVFYYFTLYNKKKNWTYVAYALMLFGLFFTFSRTIIFLWVFGYTLRTLIIFSQKKLRDIFWGKDLYRKKLIYITAVTLLVMVIFSFFFWQEALSRVQLSPQDEAVQLRIFYNKESIKSGITLFGAGIGNFVNWFMETTPGLSRYTYQPVHNIYLLIYAETGMLGIISFGLFLVFLIRNFILRTRFRLLYQYSFLILVSSFLVIGLFDHFLWTLQQGRFIFWTVLALLDIDEYIS